MLAGIDPFNDEDPMLIYQKVLKGKIKYPSSFPSNAKSLVKHILTKDLSKRYGNLKNGVNDIKNHRFFKEMDWTALVKYKLKAPYIPKTSGKGDCRNFVDYDDEEEEHDYDVPSIKSSEDPFIEW